MAELTGQDQIPEEVLHAAEDAYDAESYRHSAALYAAVALAYRAGCDAALDRDEWRVCSVGKLSGHTTYSAVLGRTNAVRRLAEVRTYRDQCWIEHRRVGASDWKRVEP